MSANLQIMLRVVSIGVGATIVLDLWSACLKRVFQIPITNWAMVGRWVGHLPGRFVHSKIADSLPVRGELLLGWSVHYAIGVSFATILIAIWGPDWLRQPTVVPALVVGVFTVVFPLFLLQPGMGLGIAASKTPRPNVARLRSLANHTIFGVGLYVAALVSAPLFRHSFAQP
ncbi:MAG TPA: DUF2938 domain-containing protein [Steroidobacteraceae bacterium]|nr:DUF2938 domain-containing protein [Steroidobacteraceae bacterium]